MRTTHGLAATLLTFVLANSAGATPNCDLGIFRIPRDMPIGVSFDGAHVQGGSALNFSIDPPVPGAERGNIQIFTWNGSTADGNFALYSDPGHSLCALGYFGPQAVRLDHWQQLAGVTDQYDYNLAIGDYSLVTYPCASCGTEDQYAVQLYLTRENPGPTRTPIYTSAPTDTPTATSTATPTFTPTASPTTEPTSTTVPTATLTLTPTLTPTNVPTETPTPTASATPTYTPTPVGTRYFCEDEVIRLPRDTNRPHFFTTAGGFNYTGRKVHAEGGGTTVACQVSVDSGAAIPLTVWGWSDQDFGICNGDASGATVLGTMAVPAAGSGQQVFVLPDGNYTFLLGDLGIHNGNPVSITFSLVYSPTPTLTPTSTATDTPTPTLTPTTTPTPTQTPTDTPSSTPTQTPTSTLTLTPSATPTTTSTPTSTATDTPTLTFTSTPTTTPTLTPTFTPSLTSTPTITPTPTPAPPGPILLAGFMDTRLVVGQSGVLTFIALSSDSSVIIVGSGGEIGPAITNPQAGVYLTEWQISASDLVFPAEALFWAVPVGQNGLVSREVWPYLNVLP